MDNRAGEMVVFVRVVEAGSFSEAARLLLMTPSTVSKLIARLEARLGVRLIERSTRRLVLTGEGQFYYERSQALLGQLDETEQQIAQGGAEAEGLIRVTSSVTFGVTALEPILPDFLEAYPRIVVDLSLSDEVVDLYLERTDIAIRVPAPQSHDAPRADHLAGRPRRIRTRGNSGSSRTNRSPFRRRFRRHRVANATFSHIKTFL